MPGVLDGSSVAVGGTQYVDCATVPLPYGERLVDDVLNRTRTADDQARTFLAMELGLRAEGNYSFIFDADAPGSSIVAADPALNITARVLQRLSQAQ